jgi:hypothetical protein
MVRIKQDELTTRTTELIIYVLVVFVEFIGYQPVDNVVDCPVFRIFRGFRLVLVDLQWSKY